MQRSALCRSRRELSNEFLLAKIGVDTAENEPLEVWWKIIQYYSFVSLAMNQTRLKSNESNESNRIFWERWLYGRYLSIPEVKEGVERMITELELQQKDHRARKDECDKQLQEVADATDATEASLKGLDTEVEELEATLAELEAELKGSIGEGPNHSNHLNHSNHSNSFKIGIFPRKLKNSENSKLSAKFRQNFIKI